MAIFQPYREDPTEYGRAMAHGRLRQNGRHVSGDEIQRALERVLGRLQLNNEKTYAYHLRYTAEQRLDAEVNAEVVLNAESYYREHYAALGQVNTWNQRDQHMAQVLMRLDQYFKSESLGAHDSSLPTEPRIVVWAHNSHGERAKDPNRGLCSTLHSSAR